MCVKESTDYVERFFRPNCTIQALYAANTSEMFYTNGGGNTLHFLRDADTLRMIF